MVIVRYHNIKYFEKFKYNNVPNKMRFVLYVQIYKETYIKCGELNLILLGTFANLQKVITVIPRLTKIIRSGITFVS